MTLREQITRILNAADGYPCARLDRTTCSATRRIPLLCRKLLEILDVVDSVYSTDEHANELLNSLKGVIRPLASNRFINDDPLEDALS